MFFIRGAPDSINFPVWFQVCKHWVLKQLSTSGSMSTKVVKRRQPATMPPINPQWRKLTRRPAQSWSSNPKLKSSRKTRRPRRRTWHRRRRTTPTFRRRSSGARARRAARSCYRWPSCPRIVRNESTGTCLFSRNDSCLTSFVFQWSCPHNSSNTSSSYNSRPRRKTVFPS